MNTNQSQSKTHALFNRVFSLPENIFIYRDGGFVDPTPQSQNELKSELDRISKQYGGGSGVDMTKFPEFKFEDPILDPINASDEKKK